MREELQLAGAAPAVATGFGEDAQAAASDAMIRLIGLVTRDMAKKPEGLAIRVAAPWPAARPRAKSWLEEPDALIGHVRLRGGPRWATAPAYPTRQAVEVWGHRDSTRQTCRG